MLRKIARVLAVIYLVYLGLSILVVLPALNLFVPRIVEENIGRKLRAEIILYNPFAFSVEARRVKLAEQNGGEFASLSLAEVNLSLTSLWHKGLVFDAVTVEDFKIHIERLNTGEFNFSDMLGSSQEPPDSDSSSTGLPGITVRKLLFDAEHINIIDNARKVPFNTHYEGLVIKVEDLSTVIEEGKPYKISAQAESGGRLEWEGTVSVPSSESSGKLTLSNISLATLSRFAEPWINFEFDNGRLEVQGDYSVNWADVLSYKVSDASLKIATVEVLPKDPVAIPDTSIALQALSLGDIALDSNSSHISAGDLLIQGLNIEAWNDAERLSLQEMLAPPQTTSMATEPEIEPESPTEEMSPWTAHLAGIQLVDNQLHWRSPFTEPPQVAVTPINAYLNDINWPFEGDSPLNLELQINALTQLAINGSLALETGQGVLDYRMSELLLKWFNPNLPEALKATISDGKVNIEGQLNLDEYLPTRVQMNGAITSFSGRIEEAETALTSWDAVRWDNLEVDLNERSVGMSRLTIHDYAGRIHIAKDGSINAQKVWQQELGGSAEVLAEDLKLEPDEPWQINVPEVFITGSAIDFMDESLPIPFRTVIGDLSGEVLNISSTEDAVTSVDINGTVDGYAPVTLIGTASPFLDSPALDLGLSFSGVDMSLLSPYSGTYAGRAIERGLLNLNLKYSLNENKLQGANEVLIKQLKLGDEVDSDKAVDLPLDLALALLTDMNGVIDLSVPVSGDMDNPQFSIGSVIGTAFFNLITKAVTAPFSLLANLVGSDDDLQRIAFSSGSSELPEAALLKLTQLSDALTQRPGLTLIITGRLNIATDQTQLKTAAMHEQLLAVGLTEEQISSHSPEYLKAIGSRYRDVSGDESKDADVPLNQQLKRVLKSIEISDLQLQQLAEDRAVAIKQHLVNTLGIASERAAIEQGNLDPEDNQFSGVELGLES